MSCSLGHRPSDTTGGDNMTARSSLTKYILLKYCTECIFRILVFSLSIFISCCVTSPYLLYFLMHSLENVASYLQIA